MDSLTQAALGAAIGELTLKKYVGNKGMLIGAIVATLPDLDIILYLFYDKFEMLSIHRGLSHSFLFCILFAILISFILKKIRFLKQTPFQKLYLFTVLALITHVVLDAFTAYGTQLLLPFSNKRIGLDSINVVDPVYTLPLILGLTGSLFKIRRANKWGLIISTAYLIVTLFVKNEMNTRLTNDLKLSDIDHSALITIPVGIASLNWYGVARNDKKLYLKKYNILKSADSDFHEFEINSYYLNELSSQQRETMKWFAKDFYVVNKYDDDIVIYNLYVDMRGVVERDSIYAPTEGYFKFSLEKSGKYAFSSGAH